jgi:transposase
MVRRLATVVLVLALLACAFSVAAGEVPRSWRERVVLLYTKYGQSPPQIYEQLAGVTAGDDVPLCLRTIYRIIASFEGYGTVVVRGDRREVRSGSLMRGHLDELVKIVRRQPDLFVDEIQTRMHERTGVVYGRSLLEAELLKKCLSEESARADGGRARRTGTAVVPGDDLEDRRQVSAIHRREPP